MHAQVAAGVLASHTGWRLQSQVGGGGSKGGCAGRRGRGGPQVDDLRRVAQRVAGKYYLEPRRQQQSWQSRHGDEPLPQMEGAPSLRLIPPLPPSPPLPPAPCSGSEGSSGGCTAQMPDRGGSNCQQAASRRSRLVLSRVQGCRSRRCRRGCRRWSTCGCGTPRSSARPCPCGAPCAPAATPRWATWCARAWTRPLTLSGAPLTS